MCSISEILLAWAECKSNFPQFLKHKPMVLDQNKQTHGTWEDTFSEVSQLSSCIALTRMLRSHSLLSFRLCSGTQDPFTRSITRRWNVRHKDKDSSAKLFPSIRVVQKPLNYFKILPDADIGCNVYICILFIFNTWVCILYKAIVFKNQIHIYFSFALKLEWCLHKKMSCIST